MDNYNYPCGSDTQDAPWNEKEIPEVEMECEVVITLSRNAVVTTNLYTEDKYGNRDFIGTYTDVEDSFRCQYYSIPFLLEELIKYINGELVGGNISNSRKVELEEILESCKGWGLGEVDITDYKLS